MALQLPTTDPQRLRVVVLSADGAVLGAGTLQGREQAGLLRDQLRIVGAFEYAPGELAGSFGCDLLLREVAGGEDEDAAAILRSARPVAPRKRTGKAARPVQAGGGSVGCWRADASISQLTRNTAAITGPITKPLSPNTTMPPSVATSTR
jgi:hypothetical protein